MHTLDHAISQGKEEEYLRMQQNPYFKQMGASNARSKEYPGWEHTLPEALQIGTGMEGVSYYGDAPVGSNLDTAPEAYGASPVGFVEQVNQARGMTPGWQDRIPQELVAPQPDVIGSLPSTIPPIIQPGQDMSTNMTEDQLMASLLQPESFQPNTQGATNQTALANALRGMTPDDLAFA